MTKKIKNNLLGTGILIAVILLIFSALSIIKYHKLAKQKNTIVGVWMVDAIGAPFQPHILTFHSDQTMEIHNPEAGDPHSSDSMGMGPWQLISSDNTTTVIGKFVELNADRLTNKYINKLVVTYKVTFKENTFTGPASAIYYRSDGGIDSGPFSVTLKGKKLLLSAENK